MKNKKFVNGFFTKCPVCNQLTLMASAGYHFRCVKCNVLLKPSEIKCLGVNNAKI